MRQSISKLARAVACCAVAMLGVDVVVAQPALPQRTLHEELRIVSNESSADMQLTPVDDAIWLPDGRLVTVHRKEAVLRVFDANGKLVRLVGRKGRGPGEFQSPSYGGYVGTTLWIHDQSRRRFVTFGADFAPLAEVNIPSSTVPGGISPVGLVSVNASVVRTFGEPSRVAIYDREGNVALPLDITFRQAPAAFEVTAIAADPNGIRAPNVGPSVTRKIGHPLTTFTDIGLLPGGQELLVLESSELWGGKPGQLRMRRLSTTTGKTLSVVTSTLTARRVSAQERDSLLAVVIKRDPNVTDQVKSKARVPDYFPAFRSFLASRDGVVWIEEPGSPNARVVIDANGTVLMRVTLPNDLHLLAVTRTTAWGLLHDADDLPILVRYKISP